jgi:hypothetical protein
MNKSKYRKLVIMNQKKAFFSMSTWIQRF